MKKIITAIGDPFVNQILSKEKNIEMSLEDIKENIKKRDYNDMHKEVGSLTRTDEQIYIDSTNMTIEEVVEEMKNIIEV